MVDITGADSTIRMLERFSNDSSVFKPLVYVGADEIADEMRRQIQNLKTDKDPKGGMRYPYDSDKEVLLEALGIAPIKDGETTNTKVGFDGYYTNKRGEQRPVPLLANSINHGTSFLVRQNFIGQTERACKDRVTERISRQADEIINKLSK